MSKVLQRPRSVRRRKDWVRCLSIRDRDGRQAETGVVFSDGVVVLHRVNSGDGPTVYLDDGLIDRERYRQCTFHYVDINVESSHGRGKLATRARHSIGRRI